MTGITVLFAGMPVCDLTASAAWYTQLFGRVANVIVSDDEVMWRCTDGGWLYVVVDPNRAGRGIATLCVDDLETAVADLESRGIICGAPAVVGTAGWKSVIVDPDGNTVSVIEVDQAGQS